MIGTSQAPSCKECLRIFMLAHKIVRTSPKRVAVIVHNFARNISFEKKNAPMFHLSLIHI